MANIKILAPFILAWEGGFANDPVDRGGATNKGVTLATWKQVGYDKDGDGDIDVDDLKKITTDDAVNVVMKPHFWDRWKADKIISQSVANILVDWVWASGKHGITNVQRLLGVKVDGIVGDKTIAALNAKEPRQLFAAIKKARVSFIEGVIRANPKQKKFRNGWLNRLACIQYGSLKYTTNGKTLTTFQFTDV